MRDARSRRSARGSRTPSPSVEAQGTLVVESIAAGGDGVGRIDGMACFTPRTAPGDRAQIAYRTQSRLARGRVLQVLEASPLRVAPRCHHYVEDRCGGCQLQHLAQDAQRDARRGIVRDAFRRIGRRDIALPELASGAEWEYRGRLTLTLLRKGRGWTGGLHAYDDASRVFRLTECPISHPALVATWLAIDSIASGLPHAPSLRLSLRLAESTMDAPSVSVLVHGGTAWPDAATWANELARVHSHVSSVWWTPEAGTTRLVHGAGHTGELDEGAVPLESLRPRSAAAEVIDGHVDDLAPLGNEALEALSFAQVNRELASALRAYVLDRVLQLQPRSVIDGYAGTGALSEALAQRGIRVTAIESDAAATARARERVSPFVDARVLTARMEQGITSVLPADVVVLNPPRRGVDSGVTRALADAGSDVRGIVYVSCDPATLARDVARLPRWSIASVHCFDMFPQTAHVETVTVLSPEVA